MNRTSFTADRPLTDAAIALGDADQSNPWSVVGAVVLQQLQVQLIVLSAERFAALRGMELAPRRGRAANSGGLPAPSMRVVSQALTIGGVPRGVMLDTATGLLQGPDRSAGGAPADGPCRTGQEFDVERLDRGDYRLVRRAAPQNEGTIDWLLAGLQKDFFVAIDSESTGAL